MDKRKLMLDSLDAAFASKKPKLVPAPSTSAPKKAVPMQPKSNKATKTTNKALDVKLNHQAKAREAVKQNESKKGPPNPLCAKVDGLLYTTKASKDKSRPPLKELEEKLLALALATQSGNAKDESLLDKVKNKILQLDNPHKAKSTTQTTATSSQPLQLPHKMSMKVRRKLGFHAPPPSVSLADADALHRLWTAYMEDFLAEIAPTMATGAFSACFYGSKLLKADFRGCHLRIARASSPALIGASGIVLDEKANTFRVLNASGVVQCFPKGSATLFEFDVAGKVFRVNGDEFRSRPY